MQIRALVCLFAVAAGTALAQTEPAVDPLIEAASLREGLASALIKGGEKPAQAVARLRAHASPSGLKIDRDADFAFAAIDVGHRLIVARRPADAEIFFREAEKSLDQLLKKTPDTAAFEKTQYLAKLAFIRANFLNNAVQAKSDLDAARKLRPDDKHLDNLRDALGKGRGDIFKDQTKN